MKKFLQGSKNLMLKSVSKEKKYKVRGASLIVGVTPAAKD